MKEIKECLFSRAIETWLLNDPNGKWFKHDDNPNCFTDGKFGRALYVYDDYVKFWSEIRVHNDFIQYPIPNSRTSLFEILNKN